jgi:hypothetical protein
MKIKTIFAVVAKVKKKKIDLLISFLNKKVVKLREETYLYLSNLLSAKCM